MIVALLIALCFFIFLFVLYALSSDDFILFRKNITLERVFNVAILTGLCALLCARLLFVAFNFSPNFFNPLVFLIFIYFPGLSLAGALGGGLLFLVMYAQVKKLPTARLLDFFSYSFLASYSVGVFATLISQLFLRRGVGVLDFIYLLVHILSLLVLGAIVLPKQKRAAIQDGTMTIIVLSFVSLVFIVSDFFTSSAKLVAFISLESIAFFLILSISLAAYFSNISISPKRKNGLHGR